MNDAVPPDDGGSVTPLCHPRRLSGKPASSPVKAAAARTGVAGNDQCRCPDAAGPGVSRRAVQPVPAHRGQPGQVVSDQ
ncbi:MAG: hypothetical protein ACRDND_03405, partial [Streptosporangiaceae bacterium]